MKTNKQLGEVIETTFEKIRNDSLTLSYAMTVVDDFMIELEDDIKNEMPINYDLIFSGNHYETIKVLNRITMAACGSVNIDEKSSLLYVMIFQIFITACLQGDLIVDSSTER